MPDLSAKVPAVAFLLAAMALFIVRPDFLSACSSLLSGNPNYDPSVPLELIIQAWLYHAYTLLLCSALVLYLAGHRRGSRILSATILLYLPVFVSSSALIAIWKPDLLDLPFGEMMHNLGVRSDSVSFTLLFCCLGLALVNWRAVYEAMHPNK